LLCLDKVIVEVLLALFVVHLLADKVTARLSLFDLLNHFICESQQNPCVRDHCYAFFAQLVDLSVQPFEVTNEFIVHHIFRAGLRFQLALSLVDLGDELGNCPLQICMLRVIRAVRYDVLPYELVVKFQLG